MSGFEPQEPPPPPSVPPVLPVEYAAPVSRSSWPTVIGVIAIVFGALAALGGLWSAVSPLIVGRLQSIMPQGQATGLEVIERWATYTAVTGLLSAIVAVLLVIAGVGLVRRRRSGVVLGKIWAGVKMLLVVVMSIGAYRIQVENWEVMTDPSSGAMPPGFGAGMGPAIGVVVLVLSLLWGWALPIFMLIWFSRCRIREEVDLWE